MKKKFKLSGMSSAASSLIAILVGLIAGFVILLISNPANAFEGLWIILKGGFNNGAKGVGQVLYYAMPIIMTGLSVGFAFKTGLFNIGAPGQLMVGGFVSVIVGVNCDWLGVFHWPVALLCGMLAGGLWALLPGIFKAKLNVNEVISCIMLNYIGMYGINYLIKNLRNAQGGFLVYDQLKNQTMNVAASAVIPKMGLDSIFFNVRGRYVDASSVNGGIFIAIALAIVVYIILQKTTFGYELKACGLNKNAAKYAGINEKKNIVLSMTIAGALAGIGAGLFYLSGSKEWEPLVSTALPAAGFNGISVALLASSNPIGCIFSALFICFLLCYTIF